MWGGSGQGGPRWAPAPPWLLATHRAPTHPPVQTQVGDCRKPRVFERCAPSHLDRLLAELGDSHYPSSREFS